QELVAGETAVAGANHDQVRVGRGADVTVGRESVPRRRAVARGDPGHVRTVPHGVGDRAAPGFDVGGDARVAGGPGVASHGAGRPPVRDALVPGVQNPRAPVPVPEVLVGEVDPRVHDPDHDAAPGEAVEALAVAAAESLDADPDDGGV